MPTTREHAVILDPPAAGEGPDCCTGGQVSLPAHGTDAEKYLQPVPCKSQKWDDLWDTRTLIEGYNGYAKSKKKEAVAVSENRRVRGFAANALIAVMSLAATNIRKIQSFYAGGQAPVGEPKPRPAKNSYTRPPSWVKYGERFPREDDPPPQPGKTVPDAA